MKYLLFILCFVSITAYGQFTKGDLFLGGSVDFSKRTVPDNPPNNVIPNLSNFLLQPQFGIFLNDKFALGGNIGFFTSRYEAATTSGTSLLNKSNRITLGIIFRRYFQISDQFYISIDGNPYYERSVTKSANSSKKKTNSIGISLIPVFSFFPSTNWGFEAGFGSISFDHTNHVSDGGVNLFRLNYGSIKLGLTYYLRRDSN